MYLDMILILISAAVIILTIYNNFFKPLISYKDYINRAASYEIILQRKKAINMFKEALNNIADLTEFEKYGLMISIGIYYYKDKKYNEANNYFKDALKIINDKNFYYDNSFKIIIRSFFLAGERIRANELYNELLSRRSYDPNFNHLTKIKNILQ